MHCGHEGQMVPLCPMTLGRWPAAALGVTVVPTSGSHKDFKWDHLSYLTQRNNDWALS